MSWQPPNQPNPAGNFHNYPGRPNGAPPAQQGEQNPPTSNYDESQHRYQFQQPTWRPVAWPANSNNIIPHHPPPAMFPPGFGMPHGAPFGLPHHMMGYGTPQTMQQQWSSAFGGQVRPGMAPFLQAQTGAPVMPQASQPQHQQFSTNASQSAAKKNPSESHRSEDKVRQKPAFGTITSSEDSSLTKTERVEESQTSTTFEETKPAKPFDMESLQRIKEWASSLVGRDWEIFWNDIEDSQTARVESEDNTPAEGDDGAGEANSEEGDIIDDWYDGRILSADVKTDGTVQGRAIFVGDDTVYEMELIQSKVRPSARAWIKRTTALLLRKDGLPSDTATADDHHHLKNIQEVSRHYEPLSLQPNPSIKLPELHDLNDILLLRKDLKAQIYLRSKLSRIVNLHGSVKYVAGELNPTEPLVNHLVECCVDLDQACDWYLRSWELLTTCFGQKSGQSSNETDSYQNRSLKYEQLLDDYMEFGKNAILNCVSMDTESSTNAKRRQLVSPPGQRRTKRRRKKYNMHEDQDVDAFGEEDFRSMVAVDQFAQRLILQTRWYLPIFATMIQTVAHLVIHPLVQWTCRADQLLGLGNDLSELLDEEGEDVSESRSDANCEAESIVSSATDDEQRLFPFDAITDCLKTLKSDPVLILADLSEKEQALHAKVEAATALAKRAKSLLVRVGEYCTGTSEDSSQCSDDEILCGLRQVAKYLETPGHGAHNIDPLATDQVEVSRITIDNAILWRAFALDVWHVSRVRERKSFIEDLVTRLEELPDPTGLAIEDVRLTLEQKVRQKAEVLESLIAVEARYTGLIQNGVVGQGIMSKKGLEIALEGLCQLPVLLIVEEKMLLRLNYIHWRERTIEQLPNDNSPVPFHLLENLYTSLNLLLQGKTEARKEATTNLIANEKVEAIIRAFTDKDTDAIDPILKERVMALYNASSDWKDRAETIISTLRVHGNPVAGSVILGTKSPTFVDIKRISDMIKEYQSLDVVIPEYVSILQAVMDDAKSWASRFEENLVKSLSIAEAGSVLSNARSLRPNGLIMDPTRQVLDTMGDLLDWHQRSRDVWGRLDVMLHDNSAAMFEDISQAIRTDVYPILAEGLEVVEYFSYKNQKRHKVSAALSLNSLEVKFNVRRSAKAPTIEKITIHPLGRLLLERIASEEFDMHEGSPMSLFVWADWHLSVAAFVKSINVHGGTPNKLSQALIHRSSEPGNNTGNDFRVQKALRDFQSREKARLEELICEAEDVERNARALLLESRELRRGCVNKMDAIKVHLASLKTTLAAVKDRASGNHGLELDSGHEVNLENDVRIFTWLAKTLSYPFLYLDETSYAIFAKRNERIPWDVLVPLAERLPQSDNSTIDDFALVSMRISELYSVAKRWQDEITRLTLLSNRGGKRRNQLQLPTKEEDQETSKLQIEKMQQLADDQILSKVEMPRESAVRTILEKSKEFDIKLHAFLRQDFDGKNADRAAYPGSRSLVGKRGEFVLFRLTGSELFESVRRAMEELAAISENVFAETPEKITFEWIQRAVTWIDELNEAATDESPFGNDTNGIFTIPEEKARILMKRGRIIFPDIPKDLKSTLSQHGIFVSANKVGQTLNVSLKKDGAHHSVGGTVIRWCPILLKCLSNDMLRMEEWQKELRVLIEDFSVFQKHKKSNQNTEEQYMYSWYRYRERAAYLWKHGSQSLVVSPRSGLISTFNQLFVQLKNHFTNHSSRTEFDKKFPRMWFLEGRPVIEQRCILLESLLYRNSLDVPPDRIALPDDGQKSFRDTCRAILTTCFTNATKSAGFDRLPDTRVISSDVLQSFCALRSWEIENAMFDHFQEDLGTTKASPEYFAKVRNLKASLNEKNISLCLEILIGNITAEKLVDMSSEELASQSVKNARARSEEEARKSALLVAVSKVNDTTKQSEDDAFGSPSKTASSAKPRSILRKSLSPILRGTEGNAPTLDSSDDEASTGSPPPDKAEDADENMDLKPPAFRSDSPPPPPPSLLNAFQPADDSTEDEGEYGEQIFCTSGGSAFQFEINQLRLTFHASLYLEDSKQSEVDRFLPDTLTAIGRLAGDEFASWVSDKAARGRWVVVPLRIVANSDRDERDLSKLTESFERQNRLAMFAPSPETKVFVVTPGFQPVAEETGAMQFGKRSSSYAVVVTRDSRLA